MPCDRALRWDKKVQYPKETSSGIFMSREKITYEK
jgi:hypothetical protein